MKNADKRARKRILAAGLLIFAAWFAWVVYYNHRLTARDLEPVVNYPMGTFVAAGDNFCYGYDCEGLSMRADGYQIMDTDVYLREKGLSADDFEDLPERICIVDVTMRYQATPEQRAAAEDGKPYVEMDMAEYIMYGQDYYEGQNYELYCVANTEANGTTGIRFHDGDECHVKLVFDLRRMFYTDYSWNHLDDLPRMLFVTGMPVLQNIVLH